MPTSSLQPLGALLTSALAFVKQYQKPVLMGIVFFGTLYTLIGGTVMHRTASGVDEMMQEIGMDTQKMQELTQRIQNGDEDAVTEMQELLTNSVGSMDHGISNAMKHQMIGRFAPLIGISGLIGGIIAVFAHAYFLLFALSPTQDAMAILRRTPKLFFPLLCVWMWMVLRSFIWVPIVVIIFPVIGLFLFWISIIPVIIVSIILFPRFFLAPVILLKEKKGIMESVSVSYERTSGYWGKIVGNCIVAGLCVAFTGLVAGMVAGIVSMIVPIAGIWLQELIKVALSVYMVVFGVHLATTLMAHPIKQ